MKIIVGLGNPERDYKGTRHNAGFEVINKLAFDFDIDLYRAKFRAHFGEGRIANQKVLLAKPQTFMNLSGESIREILEFYKVPVSDLIVIYDDVNLPVGDIRVRQNGTAGGHNGIKNIIYQLETTEFDRVRVGIGEKPKDLLLVDYVLSRFHKDEPILDGYTKAADAVVTILKDGAAKAMNLYNKKLVTNEPNPLPTA